MKLFCVGLVLLLVCFPVSELKRNLLKYDPEVNWDILRDDLVQAPTSADTKNTLPKLKRVPPFLVVSSSSDPVEAFKPEKGARDLPEALREMLLQAIGATPATPAPPTGEGCKGAVEVRCHIDRMFVRVKREIFKVNTAIRNLKLGTCTVNKVTDKYYYFLYPLTADCGFQTLSAVDDFTVKISLRYGTDGPVIRDVPFNVNIQCNYPRFFHSFKVGISPKLEGGTVHKRLKQCVYTLRATDKNGNELTGNKTIPIGSILYFEASQIAGSSVSGRFYISKCFLTTSLDPSSGPKYNVIDKGGCMMDSMASEHSKFLPIDSKSVLKFSMPSIVLNDSLSLSSAVEQKLFMHCETAAGPEKATEVYKACNYDMQEKKWKELHGDNSVCSCCDSTCDTKHLISSNINVVSSRAWKVNWGNDKDADNDFSLEDQVHVVVDP